MSNKNGKDRNGKGAGKNGKIPKKKARKSDRKQRALIVETDAGPAPYDRLMPVPSLKLAEGTTDTIEDRVVGLLTRAFCWMWDEDPDTCEWMCFATPRQM